MKLHYSPTSPFVRKVLVSAHEKGLAERIEHDQNTAVLNTNPLSKVPALITDEGIALYDSLVICDYLDSLEGAPTLIPADPESRTRVLRLHALGNGVMDAAVAWVGESRRPQDKQWDEAFAKQHEKITNGVAALSSQCADFGDVADLGTITAGAALGYLDLRLPDLGWQSAHPDLDSWYQAFSQRPSMQATAPPH